MNNTESKEIKGKLYVKSEEIESFANDVIENETLNFNSDDNIKISYMLVYPNISKYVVGKCVKATDEVKFFSDYDYIIKISGDVWDKLDDRIKRILVYHELLHIGVTYNKKGEQKLLIEPHDIRDFSTIINKFGIDWFETLKLTTSSINDMNPEDEINIKV